MPETGPKMSTTLFEALTAAAIDPFAVEKLYWRLTLSYAEHRDAAHHNGERPYTSDDARSCDNYIGGHHFLVEVIGGNAVLVVDPELPEYRQEFPLVDGLQVSATFVKLLNTLDVVTQVRNYADLSMLALHLARYYLSRGFEPIINDLSATYLAIGNLGHLWMGGRKFTLHRGSDLDTYFCVPGGPRRDAVFSFDKAMPLSTEVEKALDRLLYGETTDDEHEETKH